MFEKDAKEGKAHALLFAAALLFTDDEDSDKGRTIITSIDVSSGWDVSLSARIYNRKNKRVLNLDIPKLSEDDE